MVGGWTIPLTGRRGGSSLWGRGAADPSPGERGDEGGVAMASPPGNASGLTLPQREPTSQSSAAPAKFIFNFPSLFNNFIYI